MNLKNGYAFKSVYFQDEYSDVLVVTPGSVKIGGGYNAGKGRYYNMNGEIPSDYVMSKGDIFITLTDLTPSAQSLGYPAIIPDDKFMYLHNQRLAKVTDLTVDKYFIYQLLRLDHYHNEIAATSSGTTVKHSSIQKIYDYITFIPSDDEQKIVGKFFHEIDKTITLLQRKIDNLKKVKKGLLQKLFPLEQSINPQVRFSGFNQDWEQRKLGDIKDVRDGTHDSPKYYDKGYPLITSKNLKEWGLDLSEVNYISKEDYISFNKRSQVNIGDILFGMIGTIGNPVLIVEEKFAIKNVALIKENVNFPNIFLIQMLKSPLFNRFIQIENAGGTQKFISLSKIRGFKLFTPSLEEQMKIGKILRDADKTITLLQKELEMNNQIKKGFLQKLFPKE
ncbi:restriction endonuclease subunit S [Macrococcoides caseolyticum]|uniref:restriction endonuclease subunit S n=1 Tax=Macrococcoides caseolyticum TaxID=69966 RepID=UPI00339D9E2D